MANETTTFQDYVLKIDGTKVPISPKNGRDYKIGEVKKVVGGYVERVVLGPVGLWMFVNEDGIRLKLPVNLEATKLYRDNTRPNSNMIHGDVLVCAAGRML